MNKIDLVNVVVIKLELIKVDVFKVVDVLLEIILLMLGEGEKI